MQPTDFTQHGLKTLIYLARQPAAAVVTARELAPVLEAPYNHLAKVIHRLSKLGWIETNRGRGGGMRLANAARKLSVGSIVRELESTTEVIHCGTPGCVLQGHCELKRALDIGLAQFYRELDHTLLVDLAPTEPPAKQQEHHA